MCKTVSHAWPVSCSCRLCTHSVALPSCYHQTEERRERLPLILPQQRLQLHTIRCYNKLQQLLQRAPSGVTEDPWYCASIYSFGASPDMPGRRHMVPCSSGLATRASQNQPPSLLRTLWHSVRSSTRGPLALRRGAHSAMSARMQHHSALPCKCSAALRAAQELHPGQANNGNPPSVTRKQQSSAKTKP